MKGCFEETYGGVPCVVRWNSANGAVDRVQFQVQPMAECMIDPQVLSTWDLDLYREQILSDIYMDIDPNEDAF